MDRSKGCCLVFALVAFFSGSQSLAQTTLAKWTFEGVSFSALAASSPIVSTGSLTADLGSGQASAVHAASNSLWFTPWGNGSNKAFGGTTWVSGDYFKFSTSTVGFSNISVAWDQYSTPDGPRDFRLSYSVDGTNFVNLRTLSISDTPTWSNSTPQTGGATNFSVDLSGVSALANQGTVYFVLTVNSGTAVNGGAIGTYGYSVLDNFGVSGTAIPEPAPIALLITLLTFGMVFCLRRCRFSHSNDFRLA